MTIAALQRPRAAAEPEAQAAAFAYSPALDGLRLVAFLLVFFQHNFPPRYLPIVSTLSAYGWIGVELFFAISGYLMLRLLLAEDARRGEVNVVWFYTRRVLRIYPLMIFYTLLLVGYYHTLQPAAFGQFLSIALGLFNFVTWFRGYDTAIQYTGHLWTLSYELQVYLLVPVAYWLLKRYSAKGFVAGLLAVECFCLLARAAFAWSGAPHPVIWVTPFLRPESTLIGFAIGAGLLRLPPVAAVATLVVASAILVNGPNVDQIGSWTIVLYLLCGSIAGSLVRLVTGPTPLARLLAHPAIAFLGRISFGLYVYHFAIATQLKVRLAGLVPASPVATYAVQFVLGLALTVLVATISYFVVERPFLRAKARVTVVASRPL